MSLADRQSHFAHALLDADLPPPDGLVGPDGLPSARRFAVYRNNVVAGLIAALAEAYPVVRRIVGDDFFRAMTALYATKFPPSSPVLLTYGATFPRFLSRFPPLQGLRYLPDVARIERACVEAHHAVDATPADVLPLLTLPPARLGALRIDLHPSLHVVASHFPALTIWQSNQPGRTPHGIDMSIAETCLIVRPGVESRVYRLTLGSTGFFAALMEGETIRAAAAKGYALDPGFDFASTLQTLFLSGAVMGWKGDNHGGRSG